MHVDKQCQHDKASMHVAFTPSDHTTGMEVGQPAGSPSPTHPPSRLPVHANPNALLVRVQYGIVQHHDSLGAMI